MVVEDLSDVLEPTSFLGLLRPFVLDDVLGFRLDLGAHGFERGELGVPFLFGILAVASNQRKLNELKNIPVFVELPLY